MENYDYVIVGAGAAGCVLAARLSADNRKSVLLVEQGPPGQSLWIDMPAAMGTVIGSGLFSSTYHTQPEPALGHRQFAQIQGRTFGGSSAINGMMYVRGHPADYDAWVAAGAVGWSSATVLPYFCKAERHHTRIDPFHGNDGPLDVTSLDPQKLSPLHRAFVAAGAEAGHTTNADFNGAEQEGFGYYDQTIGRGLRSSAARAYLAGAMTRKNLTILSGCETRSILISDGRATGIMARAGHGEIAITGGEIVLCAGAYASPRLLMLSGIGPALQLAKHHIAVVKDLPGVGQNLQNHPDLVLQFRGRQKLSLRSLMRFPRKQLAGLQWLLTRTGVAATNHFEAGAFLKSRPDLERPDLQLTFFNLALKSGSTDPLDFEAFQIHVTLVRPQSRGWVALDDDQPDGPPAIRLNYLDAPVDREALHRGVEIVRDLVTQASLQPFCGEELRPGSHVSTPAAIDAWIDAELASFYHPVGTCRMGTSDDPTAVVDPQLRVHGIAGLRVVDASVMPEIPAGNTYAPTLMVAERAGDIMLGRN